MLLSNKKILLGNEFEFPLWFRFKQTYLSIENPFQCLQGKENIGCFSYYYSAFKNIHCLLFRETDNHYVKEY